MSEMTRIEWVGCYDNGWQSAPLVAEAYAHPAKISFGLAERIYRHMLAEGWLKPGDRVLDPFGGIGGCAFHAALYGLHWTGIELEPKFVALAQQNLDLWRARYAPHFPDYGSARVLQGDSRRLAEIVAAADGCVSSPPYTGAALGNGEGPRTTNAPHTKEGTPNSHTYGSTPGQLGALPAGSLAAALADGVVSSPPYADGAQHTGGTDTAPEHITGGTLRYVAYGATPGQLGALPAGNGFDGTVSSPPYETGGHHDGVFDTWGGEISQGKGGCADWAKPAGGYGDSPAQLTGHGDTFWSAAREIVAQTYAVLKPGAVAAWVTGDFVRSKQRVPFGQQWLALCESVGFEPVAWAVAWKTDDHGAQLGLLGEDKPLKRDRVSFFRRLANEKNPDSAILNEDVIFVRRPL